MGSNDMSYVNPVRGYCNNNNNYDYQSCTTA